jgi:hypothetical protein
MGQAHAFPPAFASCNNLIDCSYVHWYNERTGAPFPEFSHNYGCSDRGVSKALLCGFSLGEKASALWIC